MTMTGVWRQSPQRGPRAEPLVMGKLKAFRLPEVQMWHKFAHFCYLVNCSNMLFERILLHLAVSLRTSDSPRSNVESVFCVYATMSNLCEA